MGEKRKVTSDCFRQPSLKRTWKLRPVPGNPRHLPPSIMDQVHSGLSLTLSSLLASPTSPFLLAQTACRPAELTLCSWPLWEFSCRADLCQELQEQALESRPCSCFCWKHKASLPVGCPFPGREKRGLDTEASSWTPAWVQQNFAAKASPWAKQGTVFASRCPFCSEIVTQCYHLQQLGEMFSHYKKYWPSN